MIGHNFVDVNASSNNVVQVDHNVFYNNGIYYGTGMKLVGSNVSAFDNLFYDNDWFSMVACEDGAFVYNNYFLDSSVTNGAQLDGSCKFQNNTLAYLTVDNANSNHGVVVMSGNGNVVSNNLITDTSGNVSFRHLGGDNSTFEYNGLSNNAGDPTLLLLTDNNVFCDPKYVGHSHKDPVDVQLGDDSTCIDKGTTLSDISEDYFGNDRGLDGDGDGVVAYDLGAFEHATVLPPAAVLPQITNLTVNPSTFSPNADGVDDATSISFQVDLASDVTVEILDSSNAVVRTLMNGVSQSAGATVVTSWDGMPNSSSSAVDNGNYTVRVKATNSDGTATETVGVVVNNSAVGEPPVDDSCAGYIDVDKSNADCSAIEYMKTIGAMTGNPDGTFAPNASLQRDQIAKIVLMTFNKFDSTKDYCNGVDPFPDVHSSDWAYQYVCRGKELGIIQGYKAGEDAGKYILGRAVNRVEFLALVLRNLTESMPAIGSVSYSDVDSSAWFSGYAKYSLDHSLFVGTELFPAQATTRVEVARVIYKLHNDGKI